MEDFILVAIADRIRLLRHLNGLSLDDLAKRSDLPRHYIQAVEDAEINLTLAIIEQIADALEVKPEALLVPNYR